MRSVTFSVYNQYREYVELPHKNTAIDALHFTIPACALLTCGVIEIIGFVACALVLIFVNSVNTVFPMKFVKTVNSIKLTSREA